jgi:hypothetical protein
MAATSEDEQRLRWEYIQTDVFSTCQSIITPCRRIGYAIRA